MESTTKFAMGFNPIGSNTKCLSRKTWRDVDTACPIVKKSFLTTVSILRSVLTRVMLIKALNLATAQNFLFDTKSEKVEKLRIVCYNDH